METTRHASPLALMLATFVLAGCALPSGGADETRGAIASGGEAIEYTVRRGDRLGDIARDYTGEVGLWTRIAEHNDIEDPRTLREGTVLEIPASLVRGADVEGRILPVHLSPVVVERRFELSPIAEGAGADVAPPSAPPPASPSAPAPTSTAARADPPAPRRVRVVGSYFPKGVYAQPANYSRLMMRVAPGTLFELEREVRDWYGVVTEEGIGYLREGDAELLSSEGAERG